MSILWLALDAVIAVAFSVQDLNVNLKKLLAMVRILKNLNIDL